MKICNFVLPRYVRAAFPNGEPADVAASIVPRSFTWPGGAGMHDEPSTEAAASAAKAAEVGSVATRHEGRGVSSLFTPQKGVQVSKNNNKSFTVSGCGVRYQHA